ncbi:MULTISPECIES: hypothetical protein [unclassified Yoonia]|uniref:hypothetical protein n=1 Tax=unclassified Yoonia TaxID=2629118 RepID=UPI002AFFA7A1|nr:MULTISPECIES: hypothetical protein [unclassified Yoonia]
MSDQIALLEIPICDVTQRTSSALVTKIGEGEVMGQPAKLFITSHCHRLEVWSVGRIYSIEIADLFGLAAKAIEADLLAKCAARALAVHGVPDPDAVASRVDPS